MDLSAIMTERLPATATACFERAIEINGQKLEPDSTKAYVEFRCAYAYPVVSAYGSGFHAGTVARSHRSMRHQRFNYRHEMVSNAEVLGKEIREDRMLGMVVDVEYPREPHGGHRLTDLDQSPSIRGVAAMDKRARGVSRIMGEHLSGKKPWAVSLEVNYSLADSGALFVPPRAGEGGDEAEWKQLYGKHTPDDYARAGLWYVPLMEAPDDLFECWDVKRARFVKPYRGRNCVTLLNGINGEVHFYGLALVENPAEPAAHVSAMLAEDRGLGRFASELDRILERWA